MRALLFTGFSEGRRLTHHVQTDTDNPHLRFHQYHFQTKSGQKGQVDIAHDTESNISDVGFRIGGTYDSGGQQGIHAPGHARDVMHHVVTAIRHHVALHKPKKLKWLAMADRKDMLRGGAEGNRRHALYSRMLSRYLMRHKGSKYTISTHSGDDPRYGDKYVHLTKAEALRGRGPGHLSYSGQVSYGGERSTHSYRFKTRSGLHGHVHIVHHPDVKHSHVEFSVQGSYGSAFKERPAYSDASDTMKSVIAAVRHHVYTHKPRVITWSAMDDARDPPGKNRRHSLYSRIVTRHLKRYGQKYSVQHGRSVYDRPKTTLTKIEQLLW